MGANSGACHGENPEGAADGARGMSWEEELVREPIFVAAPSVEKKSCIAAKAKPRKTKSAVKRKRRVSFSEKDIVYDCAELYYPFVDQHESKRYDSEISRCPKSGEFFLKWGYKVELHDIAQAVAVRKAADALSEKAKPAKAMADKAVQEVKDHPIVSAGAALTAAALLISLLTTEKPLNVQAFNSFMQKLLA